MNRRLLIGCIATALSTQAYAIQNTAAAQCGIDQSTPPQRVFADPDGEQAWKEFKTTKEIPELVLGMGSAAQLWSGPQTSLLIELTQPGEDFDAYTTYCFNPSGRLTSLEYQLRTAWGWGFRYTALTKDKSLRPQTSQFFSTHTEKRIAKPKTASDIPEALKPTPYFTLTQLPFYALVAPTPLRVSGGVMMGHLLTHTTATYTAQQLRNSTSGVVVMHAIIGKNGTIEELKVISGSESLREPTLRAVRLWTFKPYLVNGNPVPVETTLTVSFQVGQLPKPDPALVR